MYIVRNAISRKKIDNDNLAFYLQLFIDIRMTQLGIMKYQCTSLAFL